MMNHRPLAALFALTLLAATPLAASAQTSPQLAELNSEWRAIPEEDRADLVLLPSLSAMDAPPPSASTIVDAALLTPDSPSWSGAEQWATAPAQVAALDALKRISERRSRFVFAQPYGRAAGNAAIDAGLWTDLGEPELIAGAQFGWFDALDHLGALVQIEATRLGAAGDGVEAMDLINRWVRFARHFADRLYYAEKSKAMSWMIFGLERLRDLAYLYPDSIDDVELRSVIRELDDRELNIGRILLPKADRLAAEELLAKTFVERGGPNPDTFGRTFAQLESRGRPLRLFAEAARWQGAASQHANYFDTRDEIGVVFNDWGLRWAVSPFDLIWDQPTDYERLDTQQFALISTVVPNVGTLFDQRLELRTEAAGSRLALAVMAYRSWTNTWPNPIFAVRPRFVSEIAIDPWNPAEDEPLKFFVPIRDLPTTERVQPGPHEIEILNAAQKYGDASVQSGGQDTPLPKEWFMPTASSTWHTLQRLVGRTAPPLSVTGWMNGERTLADLRGKVVLLDFWATWCGPCIQAIPHTNDILARYQSQGVEVIGVCATNGSGDMENVVREAGMRYPTAKDLGDSTTRSYGVQWFPFYVLIDREGTVQAEGLSTAHIEPAIKWALSNGAADLKSLESEVAQVAVSAEFEESAAPSSASIDAAPERFTVAIDDSQFILYSVGFDGEAQRARQVGPGGTDVLLWPPLISLVRAEIAGN